MEGVEEDSQCVEGDGEGSYNAVGLEEEEEIVGDTEEVEEVGMAAEIEVDLGVVAEGVTHHEVVTEEVDSAVIEVVVVVGVGVVSEAEADSPAVEGEVIHPEADSVVPPAVEEVEVNNLLERKIMDMDLEGEHLLWADLEGHLLVDLRWEWVAVEWAWEWEWEWGEEGRNEKVNLEVTRIPNDLAINLPYVSLSVPQAGMIRPTK